MKGAGKRARIARELKKLGVREAADAIGIHHSTISRFEDGERLIDFDPLIALSKLYGVSVGWILAEDVPLSAPAKKTDLPPDGPAPTPVGDRRRRKTG